MVFAALLVAIAVAYYKTSISRTLLFWAAFILTRPLGAVGGDFLDKPMSNSGLNLSRCVATAVILLLIMSFILFFPHKPARQRH